ncbi:hypothetical protein RRG08_007543 [Elysia crispata]|uniref:Uncharacterized protein n=1 Tax=Elysia crispata TaxID=231223 RepID=A0AAE0YFC4_9GAST|nr:hypothetical protein RRG08_007543 [Elysia crispata]
MNHGAPGDSVAETVPRDLQHQASLTQASSDNRHIILCVFITKLFTRAELQCVKLNIFLVFEAAWHGKQGRAKRAGRCYFWSVTVLVTESIVCHQGRGC